MIIKKIYLTNCLFSFIQIKINKMGGLCGVSNKPEMHEDRNRHITVRPTTDQQVMLTVL